MLRFYGSRRELKMYTCGYPTYPSSKGKLGLRGLLVNSSEWLRDLIQKRAGKSCLNYCRERS